MRVRPFRSCGTLKSGTSHIWSDESSRLIEWLWHVDCDSIIYGLTTNLLYTFDNCWVSTAVVLLKNVLLLVCTRKVLELGFLCFFDKILIKYEKIVACLMQYSKSIWNDQKPRCSSCIVTEPHNFKFLQFPLHGYHTPQLITYY